jgi:hypothetical protein
MSNGPRGGGNIFRDVKGNLGTIAFLDYKLEIARGGVVRGLYIRVIL